MLKRKSLRFGVRWVWKSLGQIDSFELFWTLPISLIFQQGFKLPFNDLPVLDLVTILPVPWVIHSAFLSLSYEMASSSTGHY